MAGQPVYQVNKQSEGVPDSVQLAPVRPYRLLGRKSLPRYVHQVFSLSWEPIFHIIQAAPLNNFDMDVKETFKIALGYLKARVKYVFSSPKMKPETWCVTYWSVRVQKSSIMKRGTEPDKARLPKPTRKNASRKQTVQNHNGRRVTRRRIHKNAIVIPKPLDEPPLPSP